MSIYNLSEREAQVLYLIAFEFSNREISELLFLSVNTIDSYRRKLFVKLKVKNAAGLVRRSFEEDLLPVSLETQISPDKTIEDCIQIKNRSL